jgi:hypothetical protein
MVSFDAFEWYRLQLMIEVVTLISLLVAAKAWQLAIELPLTLLLIILYRCHVRTRSKLSAIASFMDKVYIGLLSLLAR